MWDDLAKLAVAALSVGGATLQYIRVREGGRGRLKQDLDILAALPPESQAHRELSQYVEARVLRLVAAEDGARRDEMGIGVAVFCLALAVVIAVMAVNAGGYWRLALSLAIVFLLASIVGFSDSVPLRHRDAKGKIIKPDVDGAA